MTGMGSRSDLKALRRSGRGKLVVLVLLLVVAMGGAGWHFFGRPVGVGNPDLPSKVMVVARTRGLSRGLDDGGFESVQATVEEWEQKVREEIPTLDRRGTAAIMALADRFGYGYVVFEHPQDLDFSGLELAERPAMTDEVQFAVVSAGDLAFPPVMTVNPPPSRVLRDPVVVMLEALFVQPKLDALRPEHELTSIDAVQLRDRLRDAIAKLDQVPEAEKLAEQITDQVREQLFDRERAEPRPTLIGDILEHSTSFVLANAEILTIGQRMTIESRDGVRAQLRADNHTRLLWRSVEGPPESRIECQSIADAELSVHDSPRYWMSADGAALLIHSLGQGLRLWQLDSTQPGCVFTDRGAIDPPAVGLGAPVVAGHGAIARPGQVGDQGVVNVVEAGAPGNTNVGMLDQTTVHSVVWLSERHLMAVGRSPDGSGLFFFDLDTPLQVLSLPSTLFENADVVHEVAVGRRGPQPTIVVTAGESPRRAYRLDLPLALSELMAAPPTLTEGRLAAARARERSFAGLPVVVPLDPNRFVTTALVHEGHAHDVTVSADGRWVAFALHGPMFDPTAPDDSEIAVVPAAGGPLRVLTRNAVRDVRPRLTPNGSHVVFSTLTNVPRVEQTLRSTRIVPLRP